MRVRFISADGLEHDCDTSLNRPRTIQRACHSSPASFSASADPRSLRLEVREYELYRVDGVGPGALHVYRERHVPRPAPKPGLSVGAVARALFDMKHEAEALTIAENRVDQLRRVLDVMWIRTKRDSMNECIGVAAALLERARATVGSP